MTNLFLQFCIRIESASYWAETALLRTPWGKFNELLHPCHNNCDIKGASGWKHNMPPSCILSSRLTKKVQSLCSSYLLKWYVFTDFLYSSGSIEIDPFDVSNLRRYCSRRNRIGSNRTNVTKSSVQWEFEYTFFALTLNPMRKRRCLEIDEYAGDIDRKHSPAYAAKRMVQSNKKTPSLSKPSFAIWSYSLRAYWRLPGAKSIWRIPNVQWSLYGFYIFKWHHGDEMRLKHYAGILVIEF